MSSYKSEFEQLRASYETFSEDTDEGLSTETGSKMQEVECLLDTIANELKIIELELQTVYDCHQEYDNAVQDWSAWFDEAKIKLNDCKRDGGGNIDQKHRVIQVEYFSYRPSDTSGGNFILDSSIRCKRFFLELR